LYYGRAAFCSAFLWVKELNAKDIHKEIFDIYSVTCLSCKAFHSWVEKRGKHFADDKKVETEAQKWLRP
jgi:hypothetical protein